MLPSGLLAGLQLDANGNPPPPNRPFQTTSEGVILEHYQEENSGFLRVTVDAQMIAGEYFLVPFDDAPPATPVDSSRLHWQTHRLESGETHGTPANRARRRRR
jgi:hypothetical protein